MAEAVVAGMLCWPMVCNQLVKAVVITPRYTTARLRAISELDKRRSLNGFTDVSECFRWTLSH